MKSSKVTNKFCLILICIFCNSIVFAKNPVSEKLFGGIEIGSKGVKVTVLDIQNQKTGKYLLKDYWTENTGIVKGISKDGNLNPNDIQTTCEVVLKNYMKLMMQFHIDKERIYIIASSGVAMAKNKDDLSVKMKELLNRDLSFLTPEVEAKLLVRGGIPPERYLNSLILDIGGGNTKGGYIDVKNEENFIFFPLNMNLGTVTLTEKINNFTETEDLSEFLDQIPFFTKFIKFEVSKMFDSRKESRNKKNVYFSGGCVWAFATLMATKPIENFEDFKMEEVVEYNKELINNFAKFQEMAKTNAEVERVLKTYSQKHLIASSILFLATLENIESDKSRKLYFVKQGQIAWLLAYTSDTAKSAKIIY